MRVKVKSFTLYFFPKKNLKKAKKKFEKAKDFSKKAKKNFSETIKGESQFFNPLLFLHCSV